jgi:hypothetical protein
MLASIAVLATGVGGVPWPWPLAPALIAFLVAVAGAVLAYAARWVTRDRGPDRGVGR